MIGLQKLQITTLACITAIDNFYALLQLLTFVMHYWKIIKLPADRPLTNILTSKTDIAAKTTYKSFTISLVTTSRIET